MTYIFPKRWKGKLSPRLQLLWHRENINSYSKKILVSSLNVAGDDLLVLFYMSKEVYHLEQKSFSNGIDHISPLC